MICSPAKGSTSTSGLRVRPRLRNFVRPRMWRLTYSARSPLRTTASPRSRSPLASMQRRFQRLGALRRRREPLTRPLIELSLAQPAPEPITRQPVPAATNPSSTHASPTKRANPWTLLRLRADLTALYHDVAASHEAHLGAPRWTERVPREPVDRPYATVLAERHESDGSPPPS